MRIKYRVTLSTEERAQLSGMIGAGKAAARKLQHARVLLKADQAQGGPAWTDEQIVAALDVSASTVNRIRHLFVEEGLDAALNRKRPTGRQFRKLDGAQEARLIAVACSAPPPGRTCWTLRLLADKLVELQVVASITGECVRKTLKKMNSNRG